MTCDGCAAEAIRVLRFTDTKGPRDLALCAACSVHSKTVFFAFIREHGDFPPSEKLMTKAKQRGWISEALQILGKRMSALAPKSLPWWRRAFARFVAMLQVMKFWTTA